MKIGDVVRYRDGRWRVVTYDPQVKTFRLTRLDGSGEEVASNDPDVEVLFNPGDEWPFVASPVKNFAAGSILEVRRGGRELECLVDWVPTDFNRPGGSIFFNPALKLQEGDVLTATHQSGKLSRIDINKGFASIKRRRKRLERKNSPKEQPNNFSRLLDDKDWFDD